VKFRGGRARRRALEREALDQVDAYLTLPESPRLDGPRSMTSNRGKTVLPVMIPCDLCGRLLKIGLHEGRWNAATWQCAQSCTPTEHPHREA
jgi:hypothetical protein